MNTILSLPFRLEILTLGVIVWVGIYFMVNRRQVAPERRVVLAMPLDRRIPFIPEFSLVYFSTYIFVLQPFFILSDAHLFFWMLATFASITLLANLVHATLPSKIERIEKPGSRRISGKMITLFQRTCKPYGNFPSMHVALSVPVVGANFLASGSIFGSIALVWAIAIALSTLFTKQHYILDVCAGLFVGLTVTMVAWVVMG